VDTCNQALTDGAANHLGLNTLMPTADGHELSVNWYQLLVPETGQSDMALDNCPVWITLAIRSCIPQWTVV